MSSQVKALAAVRDPAGEARGFARRPGPADEAEILRLRERFRGHHIFSVVTPDRGVRYMAHGAGLGVRPHTVITDDLTELRRELEQALRPLP